MFGFNPYVIGAFLLCFITANAASYVKGRSDGHAVEVAATVDARDAAFKAFADNARDLLASATQDAINQLHARDAVIDGASRRISAARITSDEAISDLSSAVRTAGMGGCVLTAEQRVRADAFRRPAGLGLPGSPVAAMPIALPGTGARPTAPPGR